ncbi:MAG: glycosyltransferase family 4 protein [Candidatus Omnitrophica bacterium]|nr:glycosyltransferase family 4 protein [Candidatus Omnitrophota bacterium]MBU1995906.1 glycosyltransferase family 4 protein [Candidatus Omnitrophota bacterium]MBU4333542.1 glycosyltransferase family 4 protein [Candidatus Omnitrophota bacterium]
MKILFITTHLNTGGITAYLYTLTKGFVDKGHQVHIVSCGGDTENSFRDIGAKVFNVDIRTKSELSPKIYFNLSKIAKYIKDNGIDIIHSQTRVTQVMGALLKKITKRPYVSTCHGYFKPRFSRKLLPCWGDSVVAISGAVVTHLVDDFKVVKDKVTLVTSGIDLDKFNAVDEATKMERRKGFGLKEGFLVGMVARLSDVKGQDILVATMPYVLKRFPDVKLVLFGQGKLESLLKEMVSKLSIKDNVIFDPTLSKPSECMSALDVFIAPSRMEGLGLSVMEAQSCGLAVIGSRVGGIPSLIEDNKTGLLVEPENAEALAAAIIRLIEDEKLVQKLGKAAREYALLNYSSVSMIEQTMKVYEKNISS